MLLTGFEGYGGRKDNPSEEIARALDGTVVGGTRIHGRVLPVTNKNLRENIVGLINELKPSVVLCLGLAPGEKLIRLERMAANYSKFEIKDNAGEIYHGPIVPDGPAAYDSTLPMDILLSAVLECGIPARLSHSAGTFYATQCCTTRWIIVQPTTRKQSAASSMYPTNPLRLLVWY